MKKNRSLSIRNDMEGVNHFTSDLADIIIFSSYKRLVHHLKPFDDIPKSTSELLDPLLLVGRGARTLCTRGEGPPIFYRVELWAYK